MKITFILPHAGLGGGTRVVATYAERLKQRGHDVYIVSTPRRQPKMRDGLKRFLRRYGGVKTLRRKRCHLDDTDVQHYILDRKRPVIDADVPDADVVVATWWETAEWVNALSQRKGAKVYLLQGHEVFPGQPENRVRKTWLLPLHKIVVSQWLADLAKNTYGDHHISLVPNSVDTREFYSSTRRKPPHPTVGLIYSTAHIKGSDISLEAFAMAEKSLPGLGLLAFGMRKKQKDLPLPPKAIYFRKPSPNKIRDIYKSCDVWLFGSREEGFGLPILEAMACRTPVIATPAGAAPELLVNGGGVVMRTKDPLEMADAIVKICSLNENDWQELSEAAYNIATRYSWDNATSLFEQALRTAIERTERGELGRTASSP